MPGQVHLFKQFREKILLRNASSFSCSFLVILDKNRVVAETISRHRSAVEFFYGKIFTIKIKIFRKTINTFDQTQICSSDKDKFPDID